MTSAGPINAYTSDRSRLAGDQPGDADRHLNSSDPARVYALRIFVLVMTVEIILGGLLFLFCGANS